MDGFNAARYLAYRVNSNKHLHYINVVLNELHDNLRTGDLDKAFELYNEAKGAYDDLPLMAKNDIHEKVAEAATKIEEHHVAMHRNLEAEALSTQIHQLEGLLSNAELIPALEAYKSIESGYHHLDEQTREAFHPALVNVGNRIQILINNTRR
jgi:hypothetical protein